MEFHIVKKGYAPSEVEEYLAAVKREYEATIIRQRERIKELLDEKKKTDEELDAYKAKSSQISRAIVSAVSKAEEIEKLSHLKYSQEIARLKAFHEKWTKYYDKILNEYPLDSRLAAVGEFNRRMDRILSKVGREQTATAVAEDAPPASDFDPMERIGKYFAAEKEREEREKKAGEKPAEQVVATAEKPSSAAKIVRKEYADRSPSGFSFEEALNPTEDLEDILKDLGLFSCD